MEGGINRGLFRVSSGSNKEHNWSNRWFVDLDVDCCCEQCCFTIMCGMRLCGGGFSDITWGMVNSWSAKDKGRWNTTKVLDFLAWFKHVWWVVAKVEVLKELMERWGMLGCVWLPYKCNLGLLDYWTNMNKGWTLFIILEYRKISKEHKRRRKGKVLKIIVFAQSYNW